MDTSPIGTGTTSGQTHVSTPSSSTHPKPLAPLTVPEWCQGDPLAGSPTRKAPLSSQRWCSPACPLDRPRTEDASREAVPNHLDPLAHWGAAEPIRGIPSHSWA